MSSGCVPRVPCLGHLASGPLRGCLLRPRAECPHPCAPSPGLQIVAQHLSEEQILGMKQIFQQLDTDRSGTITLEEMATGLRQMGASVCEAEIQSLFSAVSACPPKVALLPGTYSGPTCSSSSSRGPPWCRGPWARTGQ